MTLDIPICRERVKRTNGIKNECKKKKGNGMNAEPEEKWKSVGKS